MDNRCIVCGGIIPSGRQVCPKCERQVMDNDSIDQLQTAYPKIQIIIFGCLYWNTGTNNSDTKTNDLGLTVPDYSEKLKEVAEEYHLPYFDHYNIGINAYTIGTYMMSDGTHPNLDGVKMLAKQIARELN